MKKLYFNYLSTFKGLSKEVWWLALITLINRAGTMVIPFLSLYLIEGLDFTKKDVAWVFTCFGLGSTIGSWLGGKLTKKMGFFNVMKISLFLTGVLFIALQFMTTFASFCIGIFLVMIVADTFRPAMFVALNTYSKPENKTRSITLIRLAINLGFSAGPALGGLIITFLNYNGLFWVDGITCILATLLLVNVLNPKKARVVDYIEEENPKSIFTDRIFWVFFISMFIFGFIFLQYFSSMTLYYKEVYSLSKFQIGLLLGFNGIVIFILEMPLIKWLENSKFSKGGLMLFGLFLVGFSFLVLLFSNWVGVLVIGMLLMTIGEMIVFPFSNAFVMERAKRGRQEEYMAYYSVAFSISHIFGHNLGLHMVDGFGFIWTWEFFVGLSVVGLVFLLGLIRMINKEKEYESKPSNYTISKCK